MESRHFTERVLRGRRWGTTKRKSDVRKGLLTRQHRVGRLYREALSMRKGEYHRVTHEMTYLLFKIYRSHTILYVLAKINLH